MKHGCKATVRFGGLLQTDSHRNLKEILAGLDMQLNETLIEAESPLIVSTIGDREVKGQGRSIAVALRRADGEVVIRPSRSTNLAQGDSI